LDLTNHTSLSTYEWTFPLSRTHTGMLQGNGTFGAMIWGEDNVLKITLNRADFWDHRGGLRWNERMTFATISELLHEKNEQGLHEIFQGGPVPPGQPARPTTLPLGRLELVFPSDLKLIRGYLHVSSGEVVVHLGREAGSTHTVTFNLAMHTPLLHLTVSEGLAFPLVRRVTAWEYVGEYLQSVSFTPPQLFEGAHQGWVQERPADPPLCLSYRQTGQELLVTAVYGESSEDARAVAAQVIDEAITRGSEALRTESARWWSEYWSRTPRLQIPNQTLSFLYYYGMYKFAGLTAPQGVAATLQGPWIEEYQMPPWSSDYHFNINVQMCYWPAYQGNHLEHLRPLFEMVWRWRDTLRQNARYFVGIDDGFMLPHAVDDRSVIISGFWSGTVDHGCTAWVGKMMYDYYLYTGDQEFLRTIAYPFLRGALRVYQAMLTLEDDQYVLPVSVSPEYRGKRLDAWGQNASFQLACIHWLCESLEQAATVLGEEADPAWREIQQKLPRACVEGESGQEQIMLWQGTPLEESHRHHSHLAGLVPFDVLDLDDPQWQPLIHRSLNHWIKQGMGMWSGWCVPWAAMLHTRLKNANAAELLLEIWERVFTNEGHGTLHDAGFPGISLIGSSLGQRRVGKREVMQMDAGMAVVAATMDMLLHARRGVYHLFSGAPQSWQHVAFSKIRTEGGFLVSAHREAGQVGEVQIVATRAGTFRLVNPWPVDVFVERDGSRETLKGELLEVSLKEGETITLSAKM
jgi:alpha-L-fucosidase 2